MSRRDTRRMLRYIRLCKPYAAQLSAFMATLSNPPTDVQVAARLFEKHHGVRPPVPWDVLPHVVKLNTQMPRRVGGLPVPTYKPAPKET